MKNIQVIDGAANATFGIFQATDEEFAAIFPDGRDIEVADELVERLGDAETERVLSPLWERQSLSARRTASMERCSTMPTRGESFFQSQSARSIGTSVTSTKPNGRSFGNIANVGFRPIADISCLAIIGSMYVPRTAAELADHFMWMALASPTYGPEHGGSGDVAETFQQTAIAVRSIKPKLNATVCNYLLARVQENWDRLQQGDLQPLKLSFGEMSHFLRSKEYRKEPPSAWRFSEHTAVKGGGR